MLPQLMNYSLVCVYNRLVRFLNDVLLSIVIIFNFRVIELVSLDHLKSFLSNFCSFFKFVSQMLTFITVSLTISYIDLFRKILLRLILISIKLKIIVILGFFSHLLLKL